MKLGDRFKVKGGKVHCVVDSWYWTAFCGLYASDMVGVTDTREPVTCGHCLRKLGKIRTVATVAGVKI
jgi:hypothetical protein